MVVKEKGQEVDGYRCDNCGHLFIEPGEAVYECSRCGGTQVEERRCGSCNIFMRKEADESCPECEDGSDIHKVELFEAPGGELFTDAAAWKKHVKEAPKRKRASEAARRRADAQLAEHRKRREAEQDLKWSLLQQALPALKRHAPKLVRDWDLEDERWRLDMFLSSTTITLDPVEFLQMAVSLNQMEERHGAL